MRRIVHALVPAALLLTSWIVPGPARAEESFEGRWEGAILFREGQIELDMVARFERLPEGEWRVLLDLPVVGVSDKQVEEVEIEGREVTLRFELDGAAQVLVGHLAESADTIEGTFQRADQPASPVYLERRAAPEERAPVEVVDLGAGVSGLRERFNQDRGAVRLVLLLSPT
mgnify:CR=1 FL=1